jgi:hypothetical protein
MDVGMAKPSRSSMVGVPLAGTLESGVWPKAYVYKRFLSYI